MASATGVPETRPSDTEETGFAGRETEPLLGRPGDATQEEGKSAFNNLVLGTGTVAQIGIWLLVILIWASVFTKPLILFSGHPLAQSLAVLVLVQSILSLQPTHTLEQKRVGQRIHIVLNVVALLSLIAGVIIIEYNKVKNHNPHFHSAHAYFGFITAVVLLLQYLVGFTMLVTPKLYGGEEKAKAIWKYHRLSGYFVLLLLLATINSATGTDYNKNVLKLKLWATLILSILVVIGVYPRIQKQKLGLGRPSLSL